VVDKRQRFEFKRKLHWRQWVTPRPLQEQPIHRWYVFPHSFAPSLVYELISEWKLTHKDRILDPFVGAGTSLLAAKEKGISACGYDLSPLAVLATEVKTTSYKQSRLDAAWKQLNRALNTFRPGELSRDYPDLVKEALPGKLLNGFDLISRSITELSCSSAERQFFRLALLSIVPEYSRKVATGGWLSWVDNRTRVTSLASRFGSRVDDMLNDYRGRRLVGPRCEVSIADARRIPEEEPRFSAVVTSPPYPNRHDYTRVFGVELMLSLLDWEQTRALRYQSFSSHPESRPCRPPARGYEMPDDLRRTLNWIRNNGNDDRIPEMLEGYFLDMYLCLREMRRVCKPRAMIAFVLGNARYAGRPIAVDKLTAAIGEQAGLKCKRLVVVRYRGNSAQQMGRYGRQRSRETIVIFQR
jgi:tRNA G10  N-methylase Trm11